MNTNEYPYYQAFDCGDANGLRYQVYRINSAESGDSIFVCAVESLAIGSKLSDMLNRGFLKGRAL